MPIYEYRCLGCRRTFSRLIMRQSDTTNLSCPQCESQSLERLFSRVAFHRSDADRMADLTEESYQDPSFYKDTRNIGLWAKKRARELGADLGDKLDEIVDKGRSGDLLDL